MTGDDQVYCDDVQRAKRALLLAIGSTNKLSENDRSYAFRQINFTVYQVTQEIERSAQAEVMRSARNAELNKLKEEGKCRL